jgi:hypothetical protein
MKALLGDVDGNSSVSSNDVGRVKSQVSNDVTADNFRADVIASGLINSTDVSAVKGQSGTGLP